MDTKRLAKPPGDEGRQVRAEMAGLRRDLATLTEEQTAFRSDLTRVTADVETLKRERPVP